MIYTKYISWFLTFILLLNFVALVAGLFANLTYRWFRIFDGLI